MWGAKQNEDFTRECIPGDLLEIAVEWIGRNLSPDEVFSDKDLSYWAEQNGYVEDE